MDLIALIEDSSTDDDDNEEEDDTQTTGAERKKFRRTGTTDVIKSSNAKQCSELFLRSVPHRKGHWAGHIQIKIPMTASSPSSLQSWKKHSVERFRHLLERNGVSGTIVQHDVLYISLSKFFSLQLSQIDSFTSRLADLVRHEHSTHLYIDPTASDDTDGINGIVLMNEEKTRSFWCWKVHANATLRRLVTHVDTVLKMYNQPTYYEAARFHVSVASFPGNIRQKLNDTDTGTGTGIGTCTGNNNNPISKDFGALEKATKLNSTSSCCLADGNESEASSSLSSLDENIIVPVTELLCTFGKTKKFILQLRG